MQGKEPWEGCCILCTWGLLSSSFKFLSIKILNWSIWTEVLPAVGNGCGRGSWNCELWLFDDLGVNRVEVYIGAQSVYVFVGWVSLSSSWSVSHSLSLFVPHTGPAMNFLWPLGAIPTWGFDVCAQSLIDKEVSVATAGKRREKGRALN